MKFCNAMILVVGVSLLLGSFAFAGNVHVNGYTRSDGTYVAPHTRSSPGSSSSSGGSYGYQNNQSTSVDGYLRKDGTCVQPHHRSTPNNSLDDNWSTKGNYNPYTGKSGNRDTDDDDNEN